MANETFDVCSIEIDSDHDFQFDEATNTLKLQGKTAQDSIKICYRTLPPELYEPYYIRNRATYSQVREYNNSINQRTQQVIKPNLFQFNNVEMIGAISRGITIGNNQDLVVNSALNLQIEGKISEQLMLQANISDQNIPFQPEGNTQQIRDFDNIYIKLYNDKFSLTAGDIVSTNPIDKAYFLQYSKNVQGLEVSANYDINEHWKGISTGLISVAKGQFTSTSLEPIEGVQGPYRLRGANNERFIIVLANSEKVYVDGKLLERGFDRQYTIDYNQSEITFSNKVLITRFSRIRVDFEYADQFYGRTNLNVAQSFKSKNTEVYFNFYQEKDNPNNPFGFENDPENIQILSLAGDNARQAFISGVDSIGIINDAILYAKIDTLINNMSYEIFAYLPLSDSNVYQVSFTEVDLGMGDYVVSNSTANGQVYRWVSPVSGSSQGNFIPEIRVNTPNQKQMSVIGATHFFSEYDQIFGELAISNTDLNLYSMIDDDDNDGLALKMGYQSKSRPIINGFKLDAGFSLEHNSKEFQPIDRFRSIEYDRDWSYNSLIDTVSREDNIIQAMIKLKRDANETLNYDFSLRNRTNVIDGTRHELGLSYQLGNFLLKTNAYFLNSKTLNSHSHWVRNMNEIRFNRGFLQPGYSYTVDRHQEVFEDSVGFSLMNFEAHNFYIQTNDTSRIRSRIDYTSRKDRLPVSGELQEYTNANEIKWTFGTSWLSNHQIDANFIYREVNELLSDQTDKNILGLISCKSHFLKRSLTNSIQYSTSNARELKRTFIYLQVPVGQGTHTWRDDNNDGIQDVNEFYEAVNIDERQFAKIFTPTDEYITAFQTTYVQTLDLKAPKKWSKNGSWVTKRLSKLAINMHLNINSKTTEDAFSRLNPFSTNAIDTATIFLRSNHRLSFFYNRNSAGFAADFTINNQDSKSLLSNGFEIREKNNFVLNIRLPLNSALIFRTRTNRGAILSSSDFLSSRNYEISIFGTEPTIIWQPTDKLRLTTHVRYDYKNAFGVEDDAYSRITKIGSNLDFIRSGRGTLNIGFDWVSIDFKGEEQSALGYELLEALRPGANQRWNVNWQQNIKDGLQLSLRYNGRNSEEQRVIHTGSMSLTAFF